MSSKTVHYCDVCGAERALGDVTVFHTLPGHGDSSLDVCKTCCRNIVRKVIDGVPVVLRPFCTNCKGRGFTTDWVEWEHDRNKKVNTPCEVCKLS